MTAESIVTPDEASLHRAVGGQYEQWPYPEPIQDLEAFYAKGVIESSAPRMVHWLYWPDGRYINVYQEKIDILVAGCGANLAAQFAYTHPKANVVGVDLSEASLKHEHYLKEKHNLTNLTLHHMPLEDVAKLDQQFDFIDCAGVLHHLPDPEKGLAALKTVLRTDGVMTILLYGLYGRIGLYMLQEAFQRLNLTQTEADVDWLAKVLSLLPEGHPVHPFLKNNLDVHYKAGLVDMFLHPLDQGFRVGDCLKLAQSANLVFQGWMDPGWYNPASLFNDAAIVDRLNQQDWVNRWQTMELLNGGMRTHSFMLCHPERDPATYSLDFESDAFLNYIPIRWVHQAIPANKATGTKMVIQRQLQPVLTLDDKQEALFSQINNGQTIAQCIKNSGIRQSSHTLEQYARHFFAQLWEMGCVMFYFNS